MQRTLLAALVFLTACGTNDSSPIEGGASPDAAPTQEQPTSCGREAPGENEPRSVVIGHPYAADGSKANVFEVLSLSPEGELQRTKTSFEMGRTSSNRIEFTPDGAIGIAVQDNGSLGVFRLEAGAVVVVHEQFEADFYATEILISEDGSEALVVDQNWRNNGGGIYRISIACDGTLTNQGLLIPSKLARAIRRIPGTNRAIVAARDLGDSASDQDLHILDIEDFAAAYRIASINAFPDENAIVTAVQITRDGRYALAADTSYDGGNRVGLVSLGDAPAIVDTLEVEDPYDILSSPYGDAIAIPSGFGDAIYTMSYDPEATSPFSAPTLLEYSGAAPALPGQGVVIQRGDLRGLALISENVGVRRVQFRTNASVTDLGVFDLGNEASDDLTAIVSAIGVTP